MQTGVLCIVGVVSPFCNISYIINLKRKIEEKTGFKIRQMNSPTAVLAIAAVVVAVCAEEL